MKEGIIIENKADFTQGSIPKKLTGFMMPILAALVLQNMYSAVDLMIVGRFGTTEGISGVSTGASIIQLFTMVIISLTTGVTVMTGRYIGLQQPERIGKLLGNAVCFFTVLGIALSLVLMIFAAPIASVMQAPEEAFDLTVEYIRICGVGFIFVVFYNFISCIFRGMGNSKLPLLFVASACVVNIAGDLVFVAALKMNVKGAAIATITSQAVSVIISLAVIRKQDLPFSITKKDFGFGSEIIRFIKIGAPLALQDVLTNMTFLAICAFVNRLGVDASSGYGVSQRIVGFVLLIPSSIIQSMSSFVAQNAGAGLETRAKKALKCGMLIGASIGVPVGLITFFGGDILSSVFTNDPGVIQRSFEYLKGFSLEAIVTGILFSYLGFFNGHSRSGFVMIQGFIQSLLIRLPISYFMSIRENASLTWIVIAAPAATVFGIIMCTLYFIHNRKNLTDRTTVSDRK